MTWIPPLPLRSCRFIPLLLALNAGGLAAAPQSFDLPAQPLSDALLNLARQVPELRLVFVPSQLEGLQAKPLQGSLEPADALNLLLTGQPLQLRRLADNSYLVEPASELQPVAAAPVQAPVRAAPVAQAVVQPMEELVTIGTRLRGRRLLQSPVPVDVVTGLALTRSAPASLGEQLQAQAPSFNYSRTMVSDGTDLVRPATLRGMNPDQLLVMVNGKRRHHQAQINIQQVVGRGSSGTDMNAIPTAMIERVEVLRDGASAQYGSDAIAGVIDLQLKQGAQDPQLDMQYGATARGDGQTLIGSLSGGAELGDADLFMALELQDRAATNRAAADQRWDPPRLAWRIGDTEQQSWSAFLNGHWDLADGQLYGYGGASRRQGLSAGFYRGAGAVAGAPPVSERYLPVRDPEGFLPLQTTRTEDEALTLGYLLALPRNWQLDLSAGYGANRFLQGTDYSVNVSLGEQSPTSAHNGELSYRRLQGLVQASGELAPEALLSLGLELRREHYGIATGDFASYAYGPQDDFALFIPSPLDPCPEQTGPVCADGQPRSRAQAGMQAFPGYRLPVSARRDGVAAFVEADWQPQDQLDLSAALRWESVGSDGRNLSGKLAGSLQLNRNLMVRGGMATGFRAPGLNQKHFTHVITNIGPDLLTNTLHAAQGNPALAALGVGELNPEQSHQASFGLVWAREDWSVMLDFFQIDVNDAIVLSDVVSGEDCQCPLAQALSQQAHNVGAVQFLYNGLDSRTRGFDLVLRNRWQGRWGELTLSLMGHYNNTEVLRLHQTSSANLYSDAQIMLTESGQPRRRVLLDGQWRQGPWQLSVRANRYGSVKTSYFTEAGLGLDLPGERESYHHSGHAWLLDAELSRQLTPALSLALGGTNLLDTYPDKLPDDSVLSEISGGSFVYPWEASPYGINGAYYYLRISAAF